MSDSDTAPVVYDLDPGCSVEDLQPGRPYLATVNGVVPYGVFVDLSDAVSGLVHESELEDRYAVGDDIVVELDERKENGDLAFVPAGIDPLGAEIETIAPDYDVVRTDDLEEHLGSTVQLESRIGQVRQTGGPTIFRLLDGHGIVPAAGFEAAGVRAYPEVEIGDLVRVTGSVERHEDSLQLEIEELDPLEGEAADAVGAEIDEAVAESAAPNDVDPLVEWDALDEMWPELERVATLLRQAILEGRPVSVRHHADGDGMCASIPLQRALERFVAEVSEDPDAPQHAIRRLPSKAPFYELEDATRDLTQALEDRARHGQRLPLVCMLDNGSTAEDVPSYETLKHYDVPIVVVDHHHPDPDAVADLVEEHVNPYLHGEDYAVTTGMLCVELARMVAPDSEADPAADLRHVPAVAGLCDRSDADAMADYIDLAADAGYDEDDLRDVGEALDYAAHWLRYDDGRHLVDDILNVGCDDPERHRELVGLLAERSREAIQKQLDATLPHAESEDLDNGATLYRIDVENHAHRFTYPAPGKTTGAVHDHMIAEHGEPAITIGYGPDFAVLRSDGVRLDIPEMVTELTEGIVGGGVSGGGHLVVGSIKYVEGRREEVLDSLVEKMAAAEIDEDLGTTTSAIE
jgi:RecJ-like exonuclease